MKRLLSITLFLLMSVYAYSIEVQGVIISKGTIRIVAFEVRRGVMGSGPLLDELQLSVPYYDEKGQKQLLLPDQADEIRFQMEGLDVRMLSCTPTDQDGKTWKPRFLQLVIDGPVRLFKFYYDAFTQHEKPAYYVFQKGNGPVIETHIDTNQLSLIGWRKRLAEYFSDCPSLNKKLLSSDVTPVEEDMLQFAKDYNEHCTKK